MDPVYLTIDVQWSPLARGVLTRPWNQLQDNASVRSQTDIAISQLYNEYSQSEKAVVDMVEQIAHARQVPMAAIATAWCLSKGVNPIIGLNSMERIDEAVLAANLTLTDEEIERLESAYTPKAVTGY